MSEVSIPPAQPRIIVHKAAGRLDLFDGPHKWRSYACITGTNPGDKQVEGDRITPLGLFYVVFKNPQSKYHLSLGLNYPNLAHALRGLKSGLLSQPQYQQLVDDLITGDMSDEAVQNRVWKTPLGGEIFIHGCAEGRTSTAGCVAVSNPDITEIYSLVGVCAPVEILP